jgi:DNA-binding transcriptional MerR regulator
MHQYGVREVEKLIHLPRSTIRAFIEAGFVSPVRGPRKAWLFSFQDLIVLRTAQALATANVPPKRIARSVKALREHLPDSMPLSGSASRLSPIASSSKKAAAAGRRSQGNTCSRSKAIRPTAH